MKSNEAVLKYLQMACDQQILWRRRPPMFCKLLSLGMIEVRRMPPTVNSKAPELFDMVVLTSAGHSELYRLQRLASRADWRSVARKDHRSEAR
jgi:hypothetical protein